MQHGEADQRRGQKKKPMLDSGVTMGELNTVTRIFIKSVYSSCSTQISLSIIIISFVLGQGLKHGHSRVYDRTSVGEEYRCAI